MPSIGFAAARNPDRVFSVMTAKISITRALRGLQRGASIPIGLDRAEAAMDVGAIGFATSESPTRVGYSGKPVPSRMSDFDEIKTLASAMAEAGHGIMQATIGRELFLREFAEIAARFIARSRTPRCLRA
jgi:hypothetical protein